MTKILNSEINLLKQKINEVLAVLDHCKGLNRSEQILEFNFCQDLLIDVFLVLKKLKEIK